MWASWPYTKPELVAIGLQSFDQALTIRDDRVGHIEVSRGLPHRALDALVVLRGLLVIAVDRDAPIVLVQVVELDLHRWGLLSVALVNLSLIQLQGVLIELEPPVDRCHREVSTCPHSRILGAEPAPQLLEFDAFVVGGGLQVPVEPLVPS
jgi:hypothetical protein